MNTKALIRVVAIVSVVMFSITACTTSEDAGQGTIIETTNGAIIVDAETATATVIGIDLATREITLVTASGQKTKHTAVPEALDFYQIKIGDEVRALVTDEVAASVGSNESRTSTSSEAVASSPVGAKRGGVIPRPTKVTAKNRRGKR